jgi:hypothetical protein
MFWDAHMISLVEQDLFIYLFGDSFLFKFVFATGFFVLNFELCITVYVVDGEFTVLGLPCSKGLPFSFSLGKLHL